MSQETVDSTESVIEATGIPQSLISDEAATVTEETPKPVKAKSPPKPKTPEIEGEPCDIKAKGSFENGMATMTVEKKCHIELPRTQIMVLETDEYKVVFHRTDIIPNPPKEDKTS